MSTRRTRTSSRLPEIRLPGYPDAEDALPDLGVVVPVSVPGREDIRRSGAVVSMDIHIGQIDHPDSDVAVNRLTHDDPYFQACWAPLLDAWTVHAVDVSARLTRPSSVRLSLDDFSETLNPAPASFQVRARTVGRALQAAAARGLAHVRWTSHVHVEVQIYRQVPLVAGSDLLRLTDPELCAHASTVADVNRRRAAAGYPLLALTPEVSERVRRADPAFRPPRPSPAEIASAHLDRLARSSTSPPGVPSLG